MKSYRIAGFTFGIEGPAQEQMLEAVPGFDVFQSVLEPECIVRFSDQMERQPFVPLHEFDYDEGALRCRFGRSGETYLFEMGDILFLRYEGGSIIEARHTGNASSLRFALWTAYSLFGLARQVIPIHASVVVKDHKAVLFLGESGTGKSTHTRLWLHHIPGTHLLNDDSPMLSLHQGRLLANGSPWSGKTDCYVDQSCPVAAIVRLYQAPENQIQRLSTIKALAAVQPSLPPAFAHEDEAFSRTFEMLNLILTQAPVYRMGCLPDAAAAQMAFQTVFQP